MPVRNSWMCSFEALEGRSSPVYPMRTSARGEGRPSGEDEARGLVGTEDNLDVNANLYGNRELLGSRGAHEKLSEAHVMFPNYPQAFSKGREHDRSKRRRF